MFKNPSFLFDILCTAAWIVLTVRYARKGFLASMVQLLGNGLSLLGAHQLSSACAGWVFEHLLAGGFRTQIAAHLSADGVVNLSGIAQQYAGFLPESFRASIVAACERSINAVLADNERVMAAAAHAGAWKWCFWIPSAISFAGAIGLVVFLRDTPSSVGLPELEE